MQNHYQQKFQSLLPRPPSSCAPPYGLALVWTPSSAYASSFSLTSSRSMYSRSATRSNHSAPFWSLPYSQQEKQPSWEIYLEIEHQLPLTLFSHFAPIALFLIALLVSYLHLSFPLSAWLPTVFHHMAPLPCSITSKFLIFASWLEFHSISFKYDLE